MASAPTLHTTIAPTAFRDDDYGYDLSVLGAAFKEAAENRGGTFSVAGGDIEDRPVLKIIFNDVESAQSFALFARHEQEANPAIPAFSLKTKIRMKIR